MRFFPFGGLARACGVMVPNWRGGMFGPGKSADFSSEASAAIDAAIICNRTAGDEGPRAVVISPTLRGSFIYSRDEAVRRLSLAFPELSEEGVKRAARHLESRVRIALRPPEQKRRSNWVNSWKED